MALYAHAHFASHGEQLELSAPTVSGRETSAPWREGERAGCVSWMPELSRALERKVPSGFALRDSVEHVSGIGRTPTVTIEGVTGSSSSNSMGADGDGGSRARTGPHTSPIPVNYGDNDGPH